MIRSSGGSCGDVAKLCSDETESGETTWLVGGSAC